MGVPDDELEDDVPDEDEDEDEDVEDDELTIVVSGLSLLPCLVGDA